MSTPSLGRSVANPHLIGAFQPFTPLETTLLMT
jgi:hypothetical protein